MSKEKFGLIEWENGDKEFAVFEQEANYDKIIRSIGFNAAEGDWEKAKVALKPKDPKTDRNICESCKGEGSHEVAGTKITCMLCNGAGSF